MSRNLKIAGSLAVAAIAAKVWAARRQPAGPSAYLPIDKPKPVAEGIWIVDGAPIHAMGLTMPVRMTVIRLGNGSLLLHSPIRHSPALAQAITELGPISHMVAPTTAHWQFMAGWQQAFPQAVTWAVPGLRDRAQVKKSGLRLDRDLGETAPPEWSGTIRQGLVRGLGLAEAWLLHEPSRTLVLTDLVENLEPARLPPVTALAARLVRGNVGRPALHVRAALLAGGEQARSDIRTMVELAPDKVVFAHGAWFATDGAARLRDAFAWV
ncbi:DUF4336 domain-containing protein [Croceibacterium ferulae]|uniref:DUF4336 domain-containing protein n=1 Tax=Croceibacterium ferulae TaxID=1854641 RepID=UPI000EAEF575|nr:DUF4336 domain-containing protein [Croceibacterium ferulae]